MRWLLRLKESEEELIAAAQSGAEGGGEEGAGEEAPGGRGSLRQEPATLSEAKILLQRAGMTAHLPALTSNWETLAAEGFDSVDALRLASAEDLVDVGFE